MAGTTVIKFGGACFEKAEDYADVARVITDRTRDGGRVVAIVSAMHHVTAWGPCHTEVMLDGSGDLATVVEINARQGGDQIWELVELVTGWDMISGAVATLAFGESPPHPGIRTGGAAIRYLTSPPGTVIGVDGLRDALAVDGVLRVSELSRPGDVVSLLGDSWNRAGYVLAVGPDADAAAATAERAVAMLVVRTTDPEPASAGGDRR